MFEELAGSFEGKSGSDKINAMIAELINNTSKYTDSTDFLIKSKEGLETLKGKV